MIRQLAAMGIFALACGVAVRFATQPVSAKPVGQTGGGAAASALQTADPFRETGGRWRHLWTRAVPDCRTLDFSGDGITVAWANESGSVRRVDAGTGQTLWQTRPLSQARRVVAASGGAILTYSPLNPNAVFVRVLHPRWGEKRASQLRMDSAVWDVSASPDAPVALCGTSSGALYRIALPAPTQNLLPVTTRLVARLGNVAEDVATAAMELSPESDAQERSSHIVAAATTTHVAGVSADGNLGGSSDLWRVSDAAMPARRSRLSLSENARTLVLTSGVGSTERDARITLRDPRTGSLLWTRALNGFAPRADVSADGETVAVAYEAIQIYRTGPMRERRLLLFNRVGEQIAPPLGSAFFAPQLVSLSADGAQVVARDVSDTIYTIDSRSGAVVSRLRLREPKKSAVTTAAQNGEADENGDGLVDATAVIRDVRTSRDGQRLLVWYEDRVVLYHTTTAASGTLP